MSAPETVRIKRKRFEQAPEALLVERTGKRQHTSETHYVLRKNQSDAASIILDAASIERHLESRKRQPSSAKISHVSGSGRDSGTRERRTFHLKRPRTPEIGIKKYRSKTDNIATFVEQRIRVDGQGCVTSAQRIRPASNSTPISATTTLKRPGRGAAIKTSAAAASNGRRHTRTNSHLEAMTAVLHQFAIEEAIKEDAEKERADKGEIFKEAPAKPKITSPPRLPAHRSRELHRERTSHHGHITNDEMNNHEVDMADEADYVYDTYVLALSSGAGATHIDTQDAAGNIGYLVITEEDQEIWETYIEDEPSDKDSDTDEDDENAEDWYGADYPDDELASDDEFGRNPYAFRQNQESDDEDWEEFDERVNKHMNLQAQPWQRKTPQQFSKYFSDVGNAE